MPVRRQHDPVVRLLEQVFELLSLSRAVSNYEYFGWVLYAFRVHSASPTKKALKPPWRRTRRQSIWDHPQPALRTRQTPWESASGQCDDRSRVLAEIPLEPGRIPSTIRVGRKAGGQFKLGSNPELTLMFKGTSYSVRNPLALLCRDRTGSHHHSGDDRLRAFLRPLRSTLGPPECLRGQPVRRSIGVYRRA